MSWTATIFLSRTTPVSTSTVTSANWQPPTPVEDRPGANLPVTLIGIRPSLRQACAQVIFSSPLTRTLPPFRERSSRPASRPGAIFSNSSSRALAAASKQGGAIDGRGGRAARALAGRERGVADVGLDLGDLQAEDLGRDDRQDRPGAGADVLRRALQLDGAVGVDDAGDLLVLRPPPPHWCRAIPSPRLIGPLPFWPRGFHRSQPISLAPRATCSR